MSNSSAAYHKSGPGPFLRTVQQRLGSAMYALRGGKTGTKNEAGAELEQPFPGNPRPGEPEDLSKWPHPRRPGQYQLVDTIHPRRPVWIPTKPGNNTPMRENGQNYGFMYLNHPMLGAGQPTRKAGEPESYNG